MDYDLLKPLIGSIPESLRDKTLKEDGFSMRFSMTIRKRFEAELVEKLGHVNKSYSNERIWHELNSNVILNTDFRSSKEGVDRFLQKLSDIVEVYASRIKSVVGLDTIILGPVDFQLNGREMKICTFFSSSEMPTHTKKEIIYMEIDASTNELSVRDNEVITRIN
jgi:hypothetical protein